jgi:hypothetical protein
LFTIDIIAISISAIGTHTINIVNITVAATFGVIIATIVRVVAIKISGICANIMVVNFNADPSNKVTFMGIQNKPDLGSKK